MSAVDRVSSPALPAEEVPTSLYVPAFPIRFPSGSVIKVELWDSGLGGRFAVGFSSLNGLIEQLGEYQPWIQATTAQLQQLLAAGGVAALVLDPEPDRVASRWTKELVDTLLEVNSGLVASCSR